MEYQLMVGIQVAYLVWIFLLIVELRSVVVDLW